MPIRERLVKAGLLCGSVAVSLLVAEGLVRLLNLDTYTYHAFSGFTRSDDTLGWDLVPGRSGVFKGRHFESHVEISPQGLRDRVYPMERRPDVRRVLVVGDSVVWCWGVEMTDCFTELVEESLPGTEVIAMGVPGFGTAQELLLYEKRGAAFDPDLVVVVFVGNDPEDNVNERGRPRFRLQGGELILTNVPIERDKSRLKEWLQAHSRLYGQMNFAIQSLKQRRETAEEAEERGDDGEAADDPVTYPNRITPESWALTTAILERFQERVEGAGACLSVLFVSKSRGTSARLREFCEARGIEFLDAGPRLREARRAGVKTRLTGDPHFARGGQEVLAATLVEFIESDAAGRCFDGRPGPARPDGQAGRSPSGRPFDETP